MSFGQNKLDRLDKSDMQTSILFSAFPLIDIQIIKQQLTQLTRFIKPIKHWVRKTHKTDL